MQILQLPDAIYTTVTGGDMSLREAIDTYPVSTNHAVCELAAACMVAPYSVRSAFDYGSTSSALHCRWDHFFPGHASQFVASV